MQPHPSCRWRFKPCGLLLSAVLPALTLAACRPALALEAVLVDASRLEGPGWSAVAPLLRMEWDADGGPRLRAQADRVSIEAVDVELEDLHASCEELRITAARIDCSRGRLRARHGLLDQGAASWSLAYGRVSGELSLRLAGLGLAGGQVRLELKLSSDAWRLEIEAASLDPGRLARLPWLAEAVAGYRDLLTSLKGRLSIEGSAAGKAGSLGRLQLSAELRDLAFSDAEGLHAGDGLGGSLRIDARLRGGRLTGDAALLLDAGEALWGPVYLQPGRSSWRASAELEHALDGGRWHLSGLRLAEQGRFSVTGDALLDLDASRPLRSAKLSLAGSVAELYSAYAEPLLDAGLRTEGRFEAELEVAEGRLERLQGRLDGVGVEDREGRLGFQGIDAELVWRDTGPPPLSRLSWEAGRVYDIPLGPSRFRLRGAGTAVRLDGEARIPIYSGALVLNALEIGDLLDPAAGWRVDAVLHPVPLEELTRALDWPLFGGRVSGMIPDVSFRDGQMKVGGVLLVRAFEGRVLVRNLRLRDPFGDLPVLSGDLELHDLDLAALTRTFSFGHIEGRLEGEVRGLRLESWRPRGFDAWLHTPEDDPSRHRISQRAVDNLSSLGGGAGVLSRSFLGIFESFGYSRLGIGCRLQGGMCEMRGVGPAANGGFYLVKGGGIPRIDVIGYTRQVDWETLLSRLRRISAAQQPDE